MSWVSEMSKLYVYLHPMPAASAGRDTIICAKLGVPVIGNRDLDAQMDLFPELAADPYDSELIAIYLKNVLGGSPQWYKHLQDRAQVMLDSYSIENGRRRANELLKELLCE